MIDVIIFTLHGLYATFLLTKSKQIGQYIRDLDTLQQKRAAFYGITSLTIFFIGHAMYHVYLAQT